MSNGAYPNLDGSSWVYALYGQDEFRISRVTLNYGLRLDHVGQWVGPDSGAQVWDAYLAGDLTGIRRYCETDVLNTYLIYMRFEMMRGRITRERYAEELERVKALLRAGKEPHLAEFLRAWEGTA